MLEVRGVLRSGCLGCGLCVADLLDALTPAPRRGPREPAAAPSDQSPSVRWVAHAGLAPRHSGRTPDHASLDRALAIGADSIELDVCVTSDGELVVRHDVVVSGRRHVGDLTLAELRRLHPQTLTIAEAVEHIGGRPEVVVDVKASRAAAPLARWLRRRRRSGLVVCSPDPAVLVHLRESAPRVERWLSLPAVNAPTRFGTATRVAAEVARTCVEGRGRSLAGELRAAARALATSRRDAACHVVGSPWRRDLPGLLEHLARDTDPGGISVEHRLVSPELCGVAVARRMRLVAWTVNAADHLRRALRNGVREVTSDDVVAMRLALGGIPLREAASP